MGKGDLTRREVFRLGTLGVLGLVSEAILPGKASAWGSVWLTNTHEYILKQAYPALKKDPAFKDSGFPRLEDILLWEGQEALYGNGKGPDSKQAKTTFSMHYYNPRLQQGGKGKVYAVSDGKPTGNYTNFGGATLAAASHFKKLCTDLRKGEGTPKSAAWAAHFMADVGVPYHIVGCHYLDLVYLLEAVESLPEEVYGSTRLCYLCPIMDPKDLKRCIDNFYHARSYDNKIDWFDPWYWNGRGLVDDETSSHVAWEGAVYKNHQPVPDPVFHAKWENPEPTFDHPELALARKVDGFAKLCAENTADNLENYFDNPQEALIGSVNAVFTIWRAAFSGLRITAATTGVEGSPAKRFVSFTLKNTADAPVQGLKARLTGAAASELKEFSHPLLQPGEEKIFEQAWSWPEPQPDRKPNLKIEAIGSYPIPDAQYASRIVAAQEQQGDWPMVFSTSRTAMVEVSGLHPTRVWGWGDNAQPEPVYAKGDARVAIRLELQRPGADGKGKARLTLEVDCTAHYTEDGIEMQPSGRQVSVQEGWHAGGRWACARDHYAFFNGDVSGDGKSVTFWCDWDMGVQNGDTVYSVSLEVGLDSAWTMPLESCGG